MIGLKKDVKSWCNACYTCDATKIGWHIKAPLTQWLLPDRMFGIIHVNTVCPLPHLRYNPTSLPSWTGQWDCWQFHCQLTNSLRTRLLRHNWMDYLPLHRARHQDHLDGWPWLLPIIFHFWHHFGSPRRVCGQQGQWPASQQLLHQRASGHDVKKTITHPTQKH